MRETERRPASDRTWPRRRARRPWSLAKRRGLRRLIRAARRSTKRDEPTTPLRVPAAVPKMRIVAPAQGRARLDWRELWSARELLAFFVWRDIKVRYRQTLLGASWALLQPAATLIVFSIVFGRLARLDSDGVPYPAFALAALVPWLFFASALSQAASSLTGNVNLITKVYFPRLLLPLSNVLSSLVDFGVMLSLLAAVLAWNDITPGWRVLLLPLPIALVITTAAGAGWWLSAVNAQYRDVRYAMPFVVQLWMYATPVVYSLQLVPTSWRTVFALNPLVGAVEAFRYALLGTNGLTLAIVGTSAVTALGMAISGALYFRRVERLIADTI